MNEPETITINDVQYVRKDSITVPELDSGDLPYVIVRCQGAGVHAGYLSSRKDGVVVLINSRRLNRWWSKFTLSGLATEGVLKGKEDSVRFACILPKLDLTESDVCEVIYCTTMARESIQSIKEYNEHE